MQAPPLTIRSIRIRAVDAPLDPPLCNSLGTITRAPLVIAELQTEEGPRGTAYAFAYSPAALLPLAALAKNIGESLAGRPCAPQSRRRLPAPAPHRAPGRPSSRRQLRPRAPRQRRPSRAPHGPRAPRSPPPAAQRRQTRPSPGPREYRPTHRVLKGQRLSQRLAARRHALGSPRSAGHSGRKLAAQRRALGSRHSVAWHHSQCVVRH